LAFRPCAIATLATDEIDAANINGVICGALDGLARAGGEETPDLCPGAKGGLLAVTNADARVTTHYTVEEQACVPS